ncbi:histidine kinase [Antarcticibacterium sp. 1MA-6-2]|uniref:sensor histidine kinase n=1 Tax=Antarcticibacterium sp. 1MA-6-2 TaxID=2908210 RepID=UPI001F48622A|nr:histidine kinase [Antarcticibacterium sp. 1MA-6-2]UJH90683.1 histidine kinase [Antarcticibacterium sp. 1MA-6-2]
MKFEQKERQESEPEINPLFHTSEFTPENFPLTENDKFLIQKLYSDDFLEQFKEYLYSRYSWWYAFQFLNYDLMMSLTFTLFILIIVLTLVFSMDVFSRKKFRFTYFNYLFPFLIVSFLTINLVFLYKILFTHSFVQDKVLLLVDAAGILLAIVVSLILWLLEKFALKGQSNFKLELILKMLFLFLSIQIPIIILITLVKEYFAYQFDSTLFTNIALLLTLGRGILLYLNHYSESLVKEKELELSRIKELNSQSQLQLLQAQINPHFLYNSLNSIAGLASIDAVKTEKMALSLSDLFRYTINQKNKKTATVADEVEMVKNYLEIEKIRFGDRLDFEIGIDPSLNLKEIPKFIIQPLIENAVKHGISKIEGQGKIILAIYKEDKSMIIAVRDNGPDFPKGLVSGHGLQTIYDLLRISYGNKATIQWNNTL